MSAASPDALRRLGRRLKWLLSLKTAIHWLTVWLFLWGGAVLCARFSGVHGIAWLAPGYFSVLPVVLGAALYARRKLPDCTKLRAWLDHHNRCGGVLMAGEACDMAAWQAHLPPLAVPEVRWRSRRAMSLLCLAASFAAGSLLLPDRLTQSSPYNRLEVGRIVGQLKEEVKTLAEEKVIEGKEAEELQRQLDQLKANSSGMDPEKTWEALDHLKEANCNAAQEGAEQALNKTAALAEAETLAQAMNQASEDGMSESVGAQAAQELAAILSSAKLEGGLLEGQTSPGGLGQTNTPAALSKEEIERLLKAINSDKESISRMLQKLATLNMIDPAMLSRWRKAGQCGNPNALAEFLKSCTNGCDGEALSQCLIPGRGGPGGGGPPAAMTWDNNTSEADLKFQEHALQPSFRPSDSQLVNVTRIAPEVTGSDVTAGNGALDNSVAGGGSAHNQVILPEHRQTVQRFFKREKN